MQIKRREATNLNKFTKCVEGEGSGWGVDEESHRRREWVARKARNESSRGTPSPATPHATTTSDMKYLWHVMIFGFVLLSWRRKSRKLEVKTRKWTRSYENTTKPLKRPSTNSRQTCNRNSPRWRHPLTTLTYFDMRSVILWRVQVTRAYEEGKREKEAMVVKYAIAEQKNIEMEVRALFERN